MDLNSKSKAELIGMCKDLGIRANNTMSKETLIEKIRTYNEGSETSGVEIQSENSDNPDTPEIPVIEDSVLEDDADEFNTLASKLYRSNSVVPEGTDLKQVEVLFMNDSASRDLLTQAAYVVRCLRGFKDKRYVGAFGTVTRVKSQRVEIMSLHAVSTFVSLINSYEEYLSADVALDILKTSKEPATTIEGICDEIVKLRSLAGINKKQCLSLDWLSEICEAVKYPHLIDD
jgi:hypothetical protein